jgi:hypothetical protein
MARKRKKKEDQKKISEKVRLLRHEGKDEKSALGEAYGMLRAGRLGRHGKYRHVGRRSKRSSRR